MSDFPNYETLKVEQPEPHLLLVTLNRPEVLNAINTQMGRDTLDLWTRMGADPGDIRCVVLTGAGDRAFCAGGELKQSDGMTNVEWLHKHEIFELSFMSLLFVLGALVTLWAEPLAGPFFSALAFAIPIHMYFQLKGAYGLGWFSAFWRTFFLLIFCAIALSLFLLAIIVLGLAG